MAARLSVPLVLCSLLPPGSTGAQLQVSGHSSTSGARQDPDAPVAKVITLLEDLVSSITSEGQTEATNYDTFACFCKDKTDERSTSVKAAQDEVDTLTAAIDGDEASKAEKQAEVAERKQKVEDFSAELDEEKANCEAQFAQHAASVAEYNKAVDQLDRAIDSLQAANQDGAAFVEVRKGGTSLKQDVEAVLALGTTLGLVKAPQNKAVQAFLQSPPGEYSFQSGAVVTTCQDLHTTFKTKRDEEQTAWDAEKTRCTTMETTLTGNIDTENGFIDTLVTDIDTLVAKIATDKTALQEEETTLADDSRYLKDLAQRCTEGAQGWDQRSQTRGEELNALGAALNILRGDATTAADGAAARALLLAKETKNSTHPVLNLASVDVLTTDSGRALIRNMKPAHAFLRHHATRASHHKQLVASDHVSASSKDHVVSLLNKEGARLKSGMLSALAQKLAKDPFAKVKTLIQDLLERILKESAQEATKKGFCDTELGKAKTDREYRFAEVKQLAAEIGDLEASKTDAEQNVASLNELLLVLHEDLNTTAAQRETENQENLAAINTTQTGFSAVQEAITILTEFYKKAGKASLVQKRASPVDSDTSGPGFSGSYQGNQDAAGGIIGILEVIAADFDRAARQTAEAEKKAEADFVEFHRASMVDITAKETKVERDTEEIAAMSNAIATKYTDLGNAQGLLDSALQTIEGLKPMCIDTGMSYDERVAKRQEEIDALKQALTALEPA